MTTKPRLAPVVAVLNMKGGVGKTTISGNVFRELYRQIAEGSTTLLVDFDAQFNLTQLVISLKAYEVFQKENRTIWNIFEASSPPNLFEISEKQRATIDSFEDFTHQLKGTNKGHKLLLVPGDFRISQLNLREKPESLELPRKRFRNFIQKARENCALVVLDCNPSSSFLTRTAVEAATHLLVPVRADKYSVLGLEILKSYVEQLPSLENQPEFLIMMNGTTDAVSTIEQELRRHAIFGPQVLVTRLPQTGVLVARPDYTGFGADRKVAYAKITRTVLSGAAYEIAKKLKLK